MIEIFMAKPAILACIIGTISFLITATGLFTNLSPIVQLDNGGKVQGRVGYSRDGLKYLEYLGIPFGEPPVGELRFEPPVPAKNWTGVKQVTKYPPLCIQFDSMVRAKTFGVEDCLYLNVFTHSVQPEVKKAVLVYIHGGGFLSGSASMYGPMYFMDEDVVLVTINYRLGPLGFLNTGDDLVRGNQGLKDQNLALQWVHKNIAAFGGDPNQVTLFGESAGSASVQYHMLSPKSAGLFQRVIAQSGAVTCPWSFMSNPKDVAMTYGKKLNCPTSSTQELITCMKNMDAKELVQPQILLMNPMTDLPMLVPSIEAVEDNDAFLTQNPRSLLKAGNFPKIPMMIGVTSGEGGLRSARFNAMPELIEELDKNWNEQAPTLLNYDKCQESVGQKIRDFYFGKNSFSEDSHDFFANLTKMYSDGLFFEPVRRAALLHAKQGAPTYFYYYDYNAAFIPNMYTVFRSIRPDGWIYSDLKVAYYLIVDWFKENVLGSQGSHEFGATHADDLFQLWNMEWHMTMLASKDYDFSKKFVKAFVDFAKNTEPLEFDGTPWPPIKVPTTESTETILHSEILQLMRIDSEGQVIPEPFSDRVQFWESLHIREPNSNQFCSNEP